MNISAGSSKLHKPLPSHKASLPYDRYRSVLLDDRGTCEQLAYGWTWRHNSWKPDTQPLKCKTNILLYHFFGSSWPALKFLMHVKHPISYWGWLNFSAAILTYICAHTNFLSKCPPPLLKGALGQGPNSTKQLIFSCRYWIPVQKFPNFHQINCMSTELCAYSNAAI